MRTVTAREMSIRVESGRRHSWYLLLVALAFNVAGTIIIILAHTAFTNHMYLTYYVGAGSLSMGGLLCVAAIFILAGCCKKDDQPTRRLTFNTLPFHNKVATVGDKEAGPSKSRLSSIEVSPKAIKPRSLVLSIVPYRPLQDESRLSSV